MSDKRTAFFIPSEQFDENGYIPSIVVEDEPGHTPLRGGPNGTPWYWGRTYNEAAAVCRKANADKGLSQEDVSTIIGSSMAVTPRD